MHYIKLIDFNLSVKYFNAYLVVEFQREICVCLPFIIYTASKTFFFFSLGGGGE